MPKNADEIKAWVVVGACCIIVLLNIQMSLSFGVITVDIIGSNEKKNETTLAKQDIIESLLVFISNGISPFSLRVIQHLGTQGYRIGAMIGITLKALSFLSSSFVPRIDWLFMTQSIIGGLANSILTVAVAHTLGEHFHQGHRFHVLATSALNISFPIGSLIFNPVNSWLVLNYGWRGTFQIASAFTFILGIICSSLIFPYKGDSHDTASTKDSTDKKEIATKQAYSSINRTITSTFDTDVKSTKNGFDERTKLIQKPSKEKSVETHDNIANTETQENSSKTEQRPLFTNKETNPGKKESKNSAHNA